ncbi:hypothetical protein ACFTZI_20875 [Streptomyces decoyicus]
MAANPVTSASRQGDDLLVAKRKVAAARSRMETPSDVTAGKSDGND